jgi:glycosyltransferase involved in cell wall biosynthesis
LGDGKPRLLIFIVAYNAETTIRNVLTRIPPTLNDHYSTEVLIIDDASGDQTFEKGHAAGAEGVLPFKLTVLRNPVNQGYGGNQKIGFHYAIERGFDIVALVHGDGQYAPEMLPDLVRPLVLGEADAVFGSRMMVAGAARRGGMPFYKLVGNRILTIFQNAILGRALSEFHSGYRLYTTAALRRIPFHLNSNIFHFDTEIIIQMMFARLRIKEIPIPTYYGDEICYVNGLRYAWDVVKTTLRARAQAMSLFYDPKYDCAPADTSQYQAKLNFDSPHTRVLEIVPPGEHVLDMGCADAYVATALSDRGCRVTGVDLKAPPPEARLERFIRGNIDDEHLPIAFGDYDYVLMLDVIEHLGAPEAFVERMRIAAGQKPDLRIVVSTGNIGFIIARLTHLLGLFNYGKRGLLDLTHKRLFTFGTLRQLFEQNGFVVESEYGIPAPFPLAIGDNVWSRMLLAFNRGLIRLRRQLFSYQIFLVVRPVPSLEWLLARAEEASSARAARAETQNAA